ncbi:hypothetical protein [Phenylobacterium sp.]|jgi:localization factor PodJL|uniref:hypothetical protein n=1 Tax=Phenylobacterium sp. TaxID=1871053 RepID=UPI0037C66977
MSAGTPWSVKGIDPKAREVAKNHARRSGLTLGAWLNQVILEDDTPDEVTQESQMARAAHRLDRPRLRTSPVNPVTEGGASTAALDWLAERLEASETRTGLAIQGVEHALRGAAARIEVIERTRSAPMEPTSEGALARLGDRLEAAEAATGRALDNLTHALEGLDRRVAAAERGGAEAAERRFEALARTLTQQVEAERRELAERLATLAPGALDARLDDLTRDVRAVEARAVGAVEAIGRQVLAMAEAVSRKLTEVDDRSATAIDQVGTEVARIAGAVELRLARGEQVQAQSFERLNAELARVAETLNVRLAQSEEKAPAGEPEAAAGPLPLQTKVEPPPRIDADTLATLGPPPAPEPELPSDLSPAAEPRAETDTEADVIDPPWRRLDLDVPETASSEAFEPIDQTADDELFESPRADGLSTREVIERARAAARAAQTAPDSSAAPTGRVRTGFGTRAATGRFFQGFGSKPRRTPNSTLQTALMIAGGAAFLSMGAAGLTLMQDGESSRTETAAPAVPAAPRAAMARATPALLGEAPAFERVRADVEAGEQGAVARLQALAGTGHSQARLYLAQLYDAGEAGLSRDPVEARKLTALAAEAGEPRAMHNLGVYLFRGEGGVQDLVQAIDWFRRAASAGIVESQYNLGLVYQSGTGVARDVSQARYWFRLAAARGDAEAKKALATLEPATAKPGQPAAATPRPTPAVAREPSPSLNVRQTQIVLLRLGYYDGPVDGRPNDAYRLALNAYQADLTTSPAARR